MDYNTIVKYLSEKMGVKEMQVKLSLKGTSALKKVDIINAEYNIEKLNPNDYIHKCNGKIPLDIYELNIIYKKSEIKVHIYSHKAKINGLEKKMVTTSKPKIPYFPRWNWYNTNYFKVL